MKLMNLFNGLSSLKNKEAGRRVFILANGPSVNSLDLSLLKDEVVIGMNASTLLEEQNGFHSKYYVVSDLRFITHPEKRPFCTSRLDGSTVRVLRKELEAADDKDLPNRSFYVNALQRDGFSKNLTAGYFFGCTTTMLAIQLGYYLGASEIYLLGCDLRYSPEAPRFYSEPNPQLEDSFTSVQIWNILNAAQLMEAEGRALYNCSAQSFLTPYVDYRNFNSLFDDSAAETSMSDVVAA